MEMPVDIVFWLEISAFVVLMGLSGFFSSSETSLFSLSHVQLERMRREGNTRVGLIESLLARPRRLIVTILIGNELVNVAASVISAALVIEFLGPENIWMNLFIMIPLLLVFGEITPKTLAIRSNVAFATVQSRYIELFARAIAPVRLVVRWVADIFITLIVGSERSRANIITEDMVRSLAREAVGEGTLDKEEAHYIEQIFDFGDKTVRQVMTPRSQVLFLYSDMSLIEMARELHRTRHTKAPVLKRDTDTVIGFLFARDLLGVDLKQGSSDADSRQLSRPLKKLLRKAYFVPESKSATDLFHTFRRRKLSVALTVDEFGGVTGLSTMEDLLECIFGEIPSSSEIIKERQVEFEKIGDREYRVDGAMTVQQFNRVIGGGLSNEIADTVGGVLLHRSGELPQEGARILADGFEFTVTRVAEHRVDEVVVRPAPEDAVETFPGAKVDGGEDGNDRSGDREEDV